MPRITTHPGAILRRELTELGLSVSRLALDLGVSRGRITAILAEHRAITADTAIRLAEYFGGKPEFWLNLQTQHDLSRLEVERGKQIRSEVRKVG